MGIICGTLLAVLVIAGLIFPDQFFFLTEGNIKLVLRAIAKVLRDNSDRISALMTAETGKLLRDRLNGKAD